jgi:hypothetical protein
MVLNYRHTFYLRQECCNFTTRSLLERFTFVNWSVCLLYQPRIKYMMQWWIYFAKHLVKRKYIIGAEDGMLCAVKSAGRFSAAPRSLLPPHPFSCCRCLCSSKYQSWTWISKDITQTGDKLRASRWLALPHRGVILTRLNNEYSLADLRILVLESLNDAAYVIEY